MKKILAMLLALCMAFTLVACAKPTDEPVTPTEPDDALDWPGNETITVVCPYGAGGDTDFMARLVFEKVQEKLGGNFIVQNITGNSGAVGAQTALEADPDGKTLLFFHTAMLVTEATGVIPFGYKDFEMVCIAGNKGNGQYFMRTDNPYGIKDFPGLVEYTKAHPGELLITYQAGGTSHLGTQMFLDAGPDCTMVDIGGKSEQLAALLSGQVDIAALPMGSAQEYVDSGEFFCLGYTGGVNSLYDPAKYPRLAEYGNADDWAMNYTLFAPKGTDPAIVKLLSDTIGDICANDEDYAKRMGDAFYILPEFKNTEDATKAYEEQAELLTQYVDALLA